MRELLIAYERINDDDIAVVCVCVHCADLCCSHIYTGIRVYSKGQFSMKISGSNAKTQLYSLHLQYVRTVRQRETVMT